MATLADNDVGEKRLVWLNMTQQELDDAYDQTKYAPDQSVARVRGAEANARAIARLGKPERLLYGPSEFEGIDFYRCRAKSAPVNIYVHGGAWRRFRSADSVALAEVFVGAGAHAAIVDFVNIDGAGGDLFVMFEQICRAVHHLYANASALGIKRDRIYLSGHSSGAHLASCLLVHDWARRGLPKTPFRAALLSSGIYDLKPARLSSRSSYVKFTDEAEQQLSLMRHLDRLSTPVIVSWGTEESPEFMRQGGDLAKALSALGKPVTPIEAKGFDHFEINRTFNNPYGLLGRLVLEQMQLVKA